MNKQLKLSLGGTNFYAVVVLLIASIFGGMSDELAAQIAGAVTGLIGATFGLRTWIKGAKLANGKSWIGDPNNWAYLSALVASILPKFAELVPGLQELTQAIAAKNWGQIVTAGVSFLSLVYYLVIKKSNLGAGANVVVIMLIVPALGMASCTKQKPAGENRVDVISIPANTPQSEAVPETHVCKAIAPIGGEKTKRAVGAFSKYWPGKQPVVSVRFLAANKTREAYFKAAASDWSKSCGIQFKYLTTGKADIRVRFDDNDGSWSYIGTDAKSITGTTTATLNVGWDGYDVCAHEIGHAIGLQHEQSNPNKGICWNEQNVIKALSGPPNYWTAEQIKFNVFDKSDPKTVNATEWDANSIMQYSIPASWVCDGNAIPGGKTLSERDKQFIASAYPGAITQTITITSEQRQRLLNAADEIKSVLQ